METLRCYEEDGVPMPTPMELLLEGLRDRLLSRLDWGFTGHDAAQREARAWSAVARIDARLAPIRRERSIAYDLIVQRRLAGMMDEWETVKREPVKRRRGRDLSVRGWTES